MKKGKNIMIKIVKELMLDVMLDNNNDGTVSAKQNDVDSRFIKITITADRHPVEINPLSTVMINACRPDGEASGFVGEVNSDGTVTVPITTWMLKVSGAVKCDVSVFDGVEKLTTMPFYINVEESLYDGEGLEDSEEHGVLSLLMSELQEIKSEEGVRVSAEKSRAEAEEERKAAETEREVAESKRTTFIPSVSEYGVISWSNDKGLENPAPVSLIPVRGRDYWTEGDRAEIISEVLDALPSAEGGVF